MIKPNKIREIITRFIPYLRENPDKLQVFLDAGQIACRGVSGLSFEYRYTLNVVVLDFPEHADLIILPLLTYLRINQPELFENKEKWDNVIRFKCDILKENLVDLSIEIDLTERVIVSKNETGRLIATHHEEPEHPDFPDLPRDIEVINKQTGEVIASYHIPAWMEAI